jgi:hypothetical protein
VVVLAVVVVVCDGGVDSSLAGGSGFVCVVTVVVVLLVEHPISSRLNAANIIRFFVRFIAPLLLLLQTAASGAYP